MIYGLLAALAAAVFVLPRLRTLMSVGCAYKAKALTSALFVSGLDIDPEKSPEVADEAYFLMRMFRAKVDRAAKTVTVSFFGLQPRAAVWREGLGATLVDGPLPPAPARRPAPPTAPLHVNTLAALTPALERAFLEPGPRRRRTRAIVILQDGAIVGERYAPGFGVATPLNGWSMTKSVTGTLIGGLVEDGRIALDRKDLLDEWKGDGRSEIALEDLLRMRSGLKFSEKYADTSSDVNRMLFDGYDAGGFAASRPLEHAPGAFWKYSSGTSNVLSLIARRALGEEAYADWPRRALFKPLGMDGAVFERDAAGTFVGSSFLFATAREWARFGQGRIGASWTKFATTPTPQAPNGRYGAHWWLKLSPELGGETPAAAALPADAFHALGHEGQCVTVIPSRRVVVVRLGLSIDIKAWDQAAFLAEALAVLPA